MPSHCIKGPILWRKLCLKIFLAKAVECFQTRLFLVESTKDVLRHLLQAREQISLSCCDSLEQFVVDISPVINIQRSTIGLAGAAILKSSQNITLHPLQWLALLVFDA